MAVARQSKASGINVLTTNLAPLLQRSNTTPDTPRNRRLITFLAELRGGN